MDRRQFLAAGGVAAASPMFAHAAASASTAQTSSLVDFSIDGLGLDPREYAERLHEAVTRRGIAADNYSNGGPIAELEVTFAALLGKPAAVFLPTGTLANHLAVRTLARGDRRVLVQADSHLYNDSGDCAATLSGLTLVPLAAGRATLALAEVEREVERGASGRVPAPVGVLSIESPVRRLDHVAADVEEMKRVCRYARERGIRLHLDGARLFNLPLHTGTSVKEYAALFDTVYVSLWKHFNGTCGAILAGDVATIDGLSDQRRLFGASLPQAWPGVILVADHAERYEQDYADAWQRADRLLGHLESHGGFRVRRLEQGTSRLFLRVEGIAPALFAKRLAARGVRIPLAGASGELLLQVNPTLARRDPATLAAQFVEALES